MESKKRVFVGNVRELNVYQLAFTSAMDIFNLTKSFPPNEKYSLTDQIRRSSRSICSNLSEGWHKRRYPAVFICKLKDAEQEASETQTWLDFALKCNYISQEKFREINEKYEHIIAKLLTMEKMADSFCKTKK